MLAYMMLNVVMNKYVPSVSITKHSQLKESPEASPRTRVESAKRIMLTADMDVMDFVQEECFQLRVKEWLKDHKINNNGNMCLFTKLEYIFWLHTYAPKLLPGLMQQVS